MEQKGDVADDEGPDVMTVLEYELLVQLVGFALGEEHFAPNQWAKGAGPLFADLHACKQGAPVEVVRAAWRIVDKVFANLCPDFGDFQSGMSSFHCKNGCGCGCGCECRSKFGMTEG